MDVHSITVGQVVAAITTITVVATFLFKIFSLFSEVKMATRTVAKAHERLDKMEQRNEAQKDALLRKVEETNAAVNLLCQAVSALIDDEVLGNEESKRQLLEMKRKLDSKKEII